MVVTDRRGRIRLRWKVFPMLLAVLGVSVTCAPEGEMSVGARGESADYTATSGTPTATTTEAEKEVISPDQTQFRIAAARGSNLYVFVINPERPSVIRIDASTLKVKAIALAGLPEELDVTPDNSTAVVLLSAQSLMALIDVETGSVVNVPIRIGMNRMRLSPDGRFAIAYFDFSKTGGKVVVTGIRTFNEVSVVDLRSRVAKNVAVGFNPTEIEFNRDSSEAYVTTDSNLAVLELPSGTLRQIAFGSDPLEGVLAAEVEVNGGGTVVFVLPTALKEIRAIDLASGAVTLVPMDGVPKDIELAPDDSALLATLPAGTANSTTPTFAVVSGSPPFSARSITAPGAYSLEAVAISPDSETAVMFSPSTTAELLTVYRIRTGSALTYPTAKPIRAVRFSPNPRYAVMKTDGGDGTPLNALDQYFDTSAAFISVDLSNVSQNAVSLEADVNEIAFESSGAYALLSLLNSKSLVITDLTTQVTDRVALPNVPKIIGTLPGRILGYAVFPHELGQISFVDLSRLLVDTRTGFELASTEAP